MNFHSYSVLFLFIAGVSCIMCNDCHILGMGRENGKITSGESDTCCQSSVGETSRSPLRVYRYVVLVLLSLMIFGANFVFDNPVALQNTIINVSICYTYVSCLSYWVQDWFWRSAWLTSRVKWRFVAMKLSQMSICSLHYTGDECECGSVFSPVLHLLMAKHCPATLWRLPGWQSVWCQIRGHSF